MTSESTQIITTQAAAAPRDTLVETLGLIAQHLGRPVPSSAFTVSLPLENGALPWAYVPEAAKRVGLVAREGELTNGSLQPMSLPALAACHNHTYLAILERRGDKLLVARDADSSRWLPVSDVLPTIKGVGYFVAAQLYLDARSELYETPFGRDWFWGPLRSNFSIYVYAAIGSLFLNVVSMVGTFYVMAVYDRVIPNRSYDTLQVLSIGVVGLYIFDFLMKHLRSHLLDSASRRFDVMVGQRVFAQMLSVMPADRPGSAGTLASTVREFDQLRDFFSSATLTLLADVPFLILYIAVIAFFAGPVALVPLLAIPVGAAVTAAFLPAMARLTDQLFRESAQRTALLYEVVTHVDTLRVIGGASWARRHWDRLLCQQAETNVASREVAHHSLNGVLFVQQLVTVGVVVMGALMVADSKMTVGAMVACTILASRAIAPVASISGLLSRLHATRSALFALDKLMKAKSENPPDSQPLHLGHVEGALTFQGVSFAYPTMGELKSPEVLNEINLYITPGEHVAIIGQVGSGKSSLLGLALRNHEPTFGHVLLDGIDVRQIHGADLRTNIGYVPQDPVLFHGTVRENLTIAHPGADDEMIIQAARVAALDELFSTTTLGLGTPVGEGGRWLSGGLRQAVTVARALINNPPVLLLDEPTSMMDPNMERTVLERLLALRARQTTVFVTHRPAVLRHVNRVVVIKGGRIVADGPRDAVLSALSATT